MTLGFGVIVIDVFLYGVTNMEGQPNFFSLQVGTGIPVFLLRTLRFAALGQELWFYVLALSRAVVVAFF